MVQRTGLGWAKVSEAQAGKLHTLLSSLVNSSGAQEREAARRECGPGAQPAQHIPWGTQCLETALTEPGVLHCLCCPVLSLSPWPCPFPKSQSTAPPRTPQRLTPLVCFSWSLSVSTLRNHTCHPFFHLTSLPLSTQNVDPLCPRCQPTGDVFHPTVLSFLGSTSSSPSYKHNTHKHRDKKHLQLGVSSFFLSLFVFLSVLWWEHWSMNCIFTSSMFWTKWEPQNLSAGVFFKSFLDLILAGIFSAGIFCPFSGSRLENKSRWKATGKGTKRATRMLRGWGNLTLQNKLGCWICLINWKKEKEKIKRRELMVELRGDKTPLVHFVRGQLSNPKFMGTGNRRGDAPCEFLEAPQPLFDPQAVPGKNPRSFKPGTKDHTDKSKSHDNILDVNPRVFSQK